MHPIGCIDTRHDSRCMSHVAHLLELAEVRLADSAVERERYVSDVYLLTECAAYNPLQVLATAKANAETVLAGGLPTQTDDAEATRERCEVLRRWLEARGWRVAFPGGPSRFPHDLEGGGAGAPDEVTAGADSKGSVSDSGASTRRRTARKAPTLDPARRTAIDRCRMVVVCITQRLMRRLATYDLSEHSCAEMQYALHVHGARGRLVPIALEAFVDGDGFSFPDDMASWRGPLAQLRTQPGVAAATLVEKTGEAASTESAIPEMVALDAILHSKLAATRPAAASLVAGRQASGGRTSAAQVRASPGALSSEDAIKVWPASAKQRCHKPTKSWECITPEHITPEMRPHEASRQGKPLPSIISRSYTYYGEHARKVSASPPAHEGTAPQGVPSSSHFGLPSAKLVGGSEPDLVAHSVLHRDMDGGAASVEAATNSSVEPSPPLAAASEIILSITLERPIGEIRLDELKARLAQRLRVEGGSGSRDLRIRCLSAPAGPSGGAESRLHQAVLQTTTGLMLHAHLDANFFLRFQPASKLDERAFHEAVDGPQGTGAPPADSGYAGVHEATGVLAKLQRRRRKGGGGKAGRGGKLPIETEARTPVGRWVPALHHSDTGRDISTVWSTIDANVHPCLTNAPNTAARPPTTSRLLHTSSFAELRPPPRKLAGSSTSHASSTASLIAHAAAAGEIMDDGEEADQLSYSLPSPERLLSSSASEIMTLRQGFDGSVRFEMHNPNVISAGEVSSASAYSRAGATSLVSVDPTATNPNRAMLVAPSGSGASEISTAAASIPAGGGHGRAVVGSCYRHSAAASGGGSSRSSATAAVKAARELTIARGFASINATAHVSPPTLGSVYEYSGIDETLDSAPPLTQWVDAGNAAVAIAATSLEPLLQRSESMMSSLSYVSEAASIDDEGGRGGRLPVELPSLLPTPLALASVITPLTSPYTSTSLLSSALQDLACELPPSAAPAASARRAFEAAVRRCWLPTHGINAADLRIETYEGGSALHPSDPGLTTLQVAMPRHFGLLLEQLLERRDAALRDLGIRAVREVAPPKRRPAQIKPVRDWLAEKQRLGRGKAAHSQLKRTLTHAMSEGALFRPALRRSDTVGDLYRTRDGLRLGGGGPRRHNDGSLAAGFMTRDPIPAFAMGKMISGKSGVTGS